MVSYEVCLGWRHGSLPNVKEHKERREGPYSERTRNQILKELEERIKVMVKGLLEALMQEERKMYLEEHCAQRSKRAGEGAKASGLCRSVDGNLPWSPGTIDEALCPRLRLL